jgi:hypothetical protein
MNPAYFITNLPTSLKNIISFFHNSIIIAFVKKSAKIRKIIIIFFIWACPVRCRSRVGARLQVRGHKPWGRKAAKRAYKLAFLPPRSQRLPPLRAFHLSASRSQVARIKHLMKRFKVERNLLCHNGNRVLLICSLFK